MPTALLVPLAASVIPVASNRRFGKLCGSAWSSLSLRRPRTAVGPLSGLKKDIEDIKNLPNDLKQVDPLAAGSALFGPLGEEKTQAVAGVVGLLACGVTACSLVTLKQTGCGLPPGPSGSVVLLEGMSYVYVSGLVGLSAVKKVVTGSGLPAGPGGLLGGSEGVAYLVIIAALAVQVVGHPPCP